MAKFLHKTNPTQPVVLLTVSDSTHREVLASDINELSQLAGVTIKKWYAKRAEIATDDASTPSDALIAFFKDNVIENTPSNNIYIVGPPGFMKTANNALVNHFKVGEGINYEFFGPHTFF